MQDIWTSFVDYIRLLLDPFGLGLYAEAIAAIPLLLLLYIVYLIIIRTARISFRQVGMPREAATGVIFGIRLLFFIMALILILSVTNVLGAGGGLTLAALLGTATGLAFSKALQNLVSGIYLLGARPFRVGDYIRISQIEGLVIDITLNYTRLLQPDHTRKMVPNAKVLESDLTNFRIRIDDYVAERGIVYESQPEAASRFGRAIEKLKYLTKGDEVYRYTFDIFVHKDYPVERVDDKFESLCAEWRYKFLEMPEFFFLGNENFGIIYRFAFIVKNPKLILTDGADFQAAIAHAIYEL